VALDPADVRKSLVVLHPNPFLKKLTERIKDEADDLLEGLFTLAKSKAVQPADRLRAMKMILDLSGLPAFTAALGVGAAKSVVAPGGTMPDDPEFPEDRRARLEALAEDDDEDRPPEPADAPGEGAGEGSGAAGDVHVGGVEGPQRPQRRGRQDSRDRKRLPRSSAGGRSARRPARPVRDRED
jgi:hypothetical protein